MLTRNNVILLFLAFNIAVLSGCIPKPERISAYKNSDNQLSCKDILKEVPEVLKFVNLTNEQNMTLWDASVVLTPGVYIVLDNIHNNATVESAKRRLKRLSQLYKSNKCEEKGASVQ